MTLLSKEQLLSTDTRRTTVTHIEEMGGDIAVRELNSRQRLDIDRQSQKGNTAEAVAHMLHYALISEDGSQLLTLDEARQFMQLHGAVVEQLATLIMSMSGLTEQARNEAKKNSKTQP